MAIAFSKLTFFDYSLSNVTPKLIHSVSLNMSFQGHGGPVRVAAALPPTNYRQTVGEEMVGTPNFVFSLEDAAGARRGVWRSESVSGPASIQHSFTIHTRRVEFELPESLPLTRKPPAEMLPYLEATELIQVNAPAIQAQAQKIRREQGDNAVALVRAIYEFTAFQIKSAHFKGETSALTTLQLGEAFCGGKSRLFAALARALDLPTRLVGGLLLTGGSKQISHIWVEVYLGDQWVPFDALNEHFAVLPENYLILYYGDLSLFTHTKDIAFRWFYKIKKRLEAPEEAVKGFLVQPFNIFHFWSTFRQANISLTLLKIILMIPLGTLVVVFFRNVVGLQTFGTFMPALMAVAFRDTGLLWGLTGFILVLAFGALVRRFLERFQLMHTPRLAIILTSVIFFVLTLASLGIRLGRVELAAVSLYPLAILTLTIERFCLLEIERGTPTALLIAFNSLLVASLAYGVMAAPLLQTLFLGFPEFYLVLVAIYVLLGSYPGLRLMELWRFRKMIQEKT